ncbi:MAG: alcohol dehydrogenase catalytic domain-containing protein [Candidatus Latescibacteria bacterium]|nr:alcohol dehydrogenase catalytic domain-containing protein [Candidatus Latescibacterota bacterium]
MKGVVKFARGSGFVEMRDVEEQTLEPNQVRIKVEATGICGSDLHVYHDTINYAIQTPVVMGHEFSGVVVEKGPAVSDAVEVGDRVTGEPSVYICGQCPYCLSEHYNLCPDRRVMGYWHDGCFAPYCNATFVHKLPDSISFEAGALTELLACCVHSVIEQAGVTAGDFVAVTGPGPVGLFSALVARAEGGTVMLCGTSADKQRLALAEELGIQHTIDVQKHDSVARVRELTGGYGADVVVECAGAPPAMRLALELVRKRGKLSQMGLPGKPLEIDFEQIAYKELQVSGGVGQRRPAWQRALKLMEMGAIPNEKLISHQLPLDQWDNAFAMAERQEGIKLLLRP